MTAHERAIIATVAQAIWEMSPVSAGRTIYTVYGHRFVNAPGSNLLLDRIEIREKLGEFESWSAARECARNAFHHDHTDTETTRLCWLTDRDNMTRADLDAFVKQAIRDNA